MAALSGVRVRELFIGIRGKIFVEGIIDQDENTAFAMHENYNIGEEDDAIAKAQEIANACGVDYLGVV